MIVVSDSSPLIGLHSIDRLDLLRLIYGRVIVPPAVAIEVQRFPLPDWIEVWPNAVQSLDAVSGPELGRGETEAIALAVQLQADWLLLDDGEARLAARSQRLRVIGLLGVLLNAKKAGFLSSIRPELEKLGLAAFHISPRLLREVLQRAGELSFAGRDSQ